MKSYVIPKRGQIPTSIIEFESLLIPDIQIASHPMIKNDEIKRCQYPLRDRTEEKAKESLNIQEDVEVLKVINAPHKPTIVSLVQILKRNG